MPLPGNQKLMMHKAEKKYEEQAKQRQIRAILNKLTPTNFEKLFEQGKAVNIDNAATLTGVVSQIFDRALMEPTYCEMYVTFSCHLAMELPDFNEGNEKMTFKRVLLNKCQEEFERGEREQEEEANKADEEGQIKQSAEEGEEKRIKARRRRLGNIRVIGELYKKKMLTEKIMHACLQKLLGQYQDPDEEDLEALCKLMSTIGEMIDHQKAKEHMDAYFDRMKTLSNNMYLSSRVRFMLKDAIDLRKNKWQQRRKVEGSKKIEEVHRDVAQEQQALVSGLGYASSISQPARRAPMDFGSRGSTTLSSPNAQMDGYSGVPSTQDVWMEERPSYESWTLSGALPQRPIGDDSITLGPQGGLGRGMSIRGSPAMSSAPVADIPSVAADSRRTAAGLNGYGTVSERTTHGAREDLIPRYISDRCATPAAYDQLSPQERNVTLGNRDLKNPDRSYNRSLATSSPARGQGTAFPQNIPSEKVLPEKRLWHMSMAAIKEFYSARDEKEVELCIKDLNSPSFHPLMVSLWVTDSFERKDMEREVLAKLLVNLTKSQDGVLSQAQLIKGFESVLTMLEDAVNDAPRAPEFLGRIFAKVVTENLIPLSEIGMLIREGGEESGRLRDLGLAGDVLGSILEMIKSEKGDSVLSEILTSSNLLLEDFRPLDPNRSRGSTMFSSANAHVGGYRGLPTQVCGYGAQDVRTEERPSYESRTLSGPLPQRPIGDDSITLGPQGGVGRGMSIRGPLAISSAPVADILSVATDSRRTAAGLKGYGTLSERTTHGAREDFIPRFISDRFAAPAAYDQLSPQERNVTLGNRDLRNPDRSYDRSLATSSPAQGLGTAFPLNIPSERVLPEERLRAMSMAAIKEFYSARDEKEVELCIKDLNSPSFHPLMVSLWVTDSFERKDMERDVLAKLLVNLTKSQDGVLSQAQLIKGFESVLTMLEDAVNDAPRAPEFLGRIFAKVITENVIPLSEIGMLIREGGEESGRHRDLGLAGDVLGSILEMIKSEKGDSVLSETLTSSNLRLEDFRPLDPNRSRGSTMLSSPNAHIGGYRGLPTQVRGYGAQDVRTEERPSYESRTLSGPLLQRPFGDDSIALGPQGGLGRGMSIRGPPAMSSAPVADIPSLAADSRRTAAGLKGYGTVSERKTHGAMEDLIPRYILDRFAAPAGYDQLSPHEQNVTLGNRDLKNPDRSYDRSLATSSLARGQGTTFPLNIPSEKVLPEERLRAMSMAAIKEFYSARDEKEVELCIKDLNSPSFHPLMVSLWVTDSFERKDMERDVLAKLLVNLTKSQDGVLSQAQLIKGFESVLTMLEDAVNDAPRAPEFLGRIFAKVITENVIPLSEIGMLIREGGEESGRLRDLGLAGDVLGSILEMIKYEKGDSVLSEILTSSNLRLEDFRPLDPNRSRKLEKFI